MKLSDWITLGVGIGTILSTFLGAWLGAYISGRNAGNQSVSTLGFQLKYEMLTAEIKDIKNKTVAIVDINRKLKHLMGTIEETSNLIKGVSQNNEYYLNELKLKINFLVEDICNSNEVNLSNNALRNFIDIKVVCKQLPYIYETIVNEKIVETRLYASNSLAKVTSQILKGVKEIEREVTIALKLKEEKTKEIESISKDIYNLLDEK